MAMGDGDDGLGRLEAVLRQSSSRSSLYQWMRGRHDALAERLVELRPNWGALAREFAAMGLTDGTGKPASAEVARRTWWQVRKDAAAAAAKRAARIAPATKAVPLSPSLPSPAPALPAIALDGAEPDGASVEFKPARLRGRTPTPAPDGT